MKNFGGLGWLGFLVPGMVVAGTGVGLPALELPLGVGVNIHFVRGHEADLDRIAAAGCRWVRMDFSWGATERVRGTYDWSAYDALTRQLEARGLRALYILDYSNEQYEEAVVTRDPVSGREQRGVAAPRHPESMAAFARWAAAAAAHYRGRGVLWEVWNEPNIGFWRPRPDVAEYVRLLQAVMPAVRAADPEAMLVAPASSEFPWAFFERLFEAPGVVAGLDAVSVHPYRGGPPETVVADYLRLRVLLADRVPPGRALPPVISGEWGYTTADGGVTPELQAAYLVRQQLVNLWQGVPISIWYDWKNDGTDPREREHNFGTVTHDLQAKPAYVALQTMTRELAGYRVVRRLDLGAPEDYVLLMGRDGAPAKLAAWTTGTPHRLRLPAGLPAPDVAHAVDGQGKREEDLGAKGAEDVAVGPQPIFLTLRPESVWGRAATSWHREPAVPLRVRGGAGARLEVPVRIRNPFDHDVEIEAALSVGAVTGAVERIRLGGQTQAQRGLSWPVDRRDAEPLDVGVHLAWHLPGLQGARPEFTERSTVVLSNPLLIETAPVEGGLRLTVRNPSGEPFEGWLRTAGGDTVVPVRLAAGQIETVMRLEPADGSTPVAVSLADAAGVVAEGPPAHWVPLDLRGARVVLDGDDRVTAQANLVLTNAPPDPEPPFGRAFRLDYTWEPGWRFVRCVAEASRAVALRDGASRYGVWVRGDGSGNALRIRVRDAGGQTFQVDGPRLTWTDWRWVEFLLDALAGAGHWGGAGDGVVRGRLELDTPLLIDGTRERSSGVVWFACPAIR